MSAYTIAVKITGDAQKFEASLEKVQTKLKSVSNRLDGIGSGFTNMGKALLPVTAAVGGLMVSTGKTAISFLALKEKASIAFETLLGSADASKKMLDDLYTFAKTTPFSYDLYLEAGQSLIAMGVAASDTVPYLQAITDAAVGSGKGQEGIDALTRAFGRMTSKGKVSMEEMNMVTEAGIPAVKILANQYGVTQEEMFKMISTGNVLADDALPKLIDGMNKGTDGANGLTAAYGGMANKMKGTLSGAIDSVRSAFRNAAIEMWDAEKAYPALVEVINTFKETVGHLPAVFKALGDSATPVLENLNEKLKGFNDYLKNANPEQLAAVGKIILGLAAAGPILLALGGAFSFVSKMVGFFHSSLEIAKAASEGFRLAVTGMSTGLSFMQGQVSRATAGLKTMAEAFRVEKAANATRAALYGTSNAARSTTASLYGTSVTLPLLDRLKLKMQAVGRQAQVMAVSTKTSMMAMGGGIKTAMVSVGTSIRTAAVSFGAFMAPLLPIIAIVGLLAAAIAYLWKTDEGFRAEMVQAGNDIKTAFLPVLEALKTMVQEVVAALIPAVQSMMPAIQALATAFAGVLTSIAPVIAQLVTALVPAITTIIKVVAQLMGTIAPIIAQLVTALVPAITMIITTVSEIITALAPALITIIGAISEVITALAPVITFIVQMVAVAIVTIINIIVPIIQFIASVITKIIEIITPIIVFIAEVIAQIITIITTIIGKVASVFNTVKTTITNVWDGIKSFIGSAISAIGSVISRIVGPVQAAFGRVRSIVTGVFSAIQSSWSGLTSFVSNIVNGIVSSFERLVSTVKSVINTVIRGINAAISVINKIPGVSIGAIPQLYRGTDDWQGGFAAINEGGRGEMVYLPGGTQVIPHDVSMKYAKESARMTTGGQSIDPDTLRQAVVEGIMSLAGPLQEGMSTAMDGTAFVVDNREFGKLLRGVY